MVAGRGVSLALNGTEVGLLTELHSYVIASIHFTIDAVTGEEGGGAGGEKKQPFQQQGGTNTIP